MYVITWRGVLILTFYVHSWPGYIHCTYGKMTIWSYVCNGKDHWFTPKFPTIPSEENWLYALCTVSFKSRPCTVKFPVLNLWPYFVSPWITLFYYCVAVFEYVYCIRKKFQSRKFHKFCRWPFNYETSPKLSMYKTCCSLWKHSLQNFSSKYSLTQ